MFVLYIAHQVQPYTFLALVAEFLEKSNLFLVVLNHYGPA